VIIAYWNNFKINPFENVLNNLEFGVNILANCNISNLFKMILKHKGKSFQKFNINGSIGIECIHNDYIIKMYAKGKQYNIPDNILRIEIKAIKMKFFEDKEINIKVIANLLNKTNIDALGKVLLSMWDNIQLVDHAIDENELTPSERLIFAKGSNPNFRECNLPNSKDYPGGNLNKEYDRKRKKYYRVQKRFKKILSKYSNSNLKSEIRILIENKWNQLSVIDDKTRDKLTDFLNQFQSQTGDKLTGLENSQKVQINILDIPLDCPLPPIRTCLFCGTDISDKKSIAKYCSIKCKNSYTNPRLNPRNNLLSRLERAKIEVGLFDVQEFIVLSSEQNDLLSRGNSIYR